MTQVMMSTALGVRREGVNMAAQRLQRDKEYPLHSISPTDAAAHDRDGGRKWVVPPHVTRLRYDKASRLSYEPKGKWQKMEILDLVGQSRETVEKTLRDRCSRYGRVNSVTIRRPHECLDATAAIEMASISEAQHLDANVGDGRFGTTVTINLIHSLPFSVVEKRTPKVEAR